MKQHITFKQATRLDKPLIHAWWHEQHVKEFWDNSSQMWENVENYLDNGVKNLFDYWLGFYDGIAFALVMSSEIDITKTSVYQSHCPKEGRTYTIDFMIGEKTYLGKGLAPATLQTFMACCPADVVNFLIDPASSNARAVHVYHKAGFREIERFTPAKGSFAGKEHVLMRCRREYL